MKKLGFGMMRLPLLNEEDKKSIDKKTVCQMVDTFMERGFTYFDTAPAIIYLWRIPFCRWTAITHWM